MSKNDLSMAYVVRGGVGELRSSVLRRLIDGLDRGETPDGLNVTWKWRNTPNQDMREADFATVIAESRPSFVMLMRGRLERDLRKALDAEGEAAVSMAEAREDERADAVGSGRGADGDRPGRSPGVRRRRVRARGGSKAGSRSGKGAARKSKAPARARKGQRSVARRTKKGGRR